jgi:hypothetical protein
MQLTNVRTAVEPLLKRISCLHYYTTRGKPRGMTRSYGPETTWDKQHKKSIYRCSLIKTICRYEPFAYQPKNKMQLDNKMNA